MNNKIEEIYQIVNNIEYSREIPKEAEQIAKDNNIIVIVGGSDDLMYAYGSKCYLTDYCEHCYGWDGNTLRDICDKLLENEATQLGLEIYWCGKILDKNENIIKEIPEYDYKKSGAFSYKVNENINHKHFIVLEEKNDPTNVYCTGIIIELPKDFKISKRK